MDNRDVIYDTKAYKRSRISYMLECMFEYFVTILISDAYLSSLLTALGMSDYMVGVLSSLVSLAFVFQLISMFLVQRISNTKVVSSLVHVVGRMFFVALYFIPFFDFIPNDYKGVVAVVCILLGYLGSYMVSTIIYRWGNSFVHPAKRATFAATKEMLSLICGMLFTLLIGQVVDVYDNGESSNAVFIFLGSTIFVSSLLDFLCLLIMKKENKEEVVSTETKPLRIIIGDLAKNKGFLSLVLLDCLHKAGIYFIVGFLGTFKLKELGMTIGLVSVVGVISTIARFFVSRPFGRFSDKTSYVTGITLGLVIQAVSYVFLIFITPNLWWMIIAYQVLYSVSLAATNQNFQNAVFSYVDEEHFVQAFSIKNCISGVVGFLISLAAAAIVRAVQGESGEGMINLFGMNMYVQQLLAIFALIFIVLSFIFVRVVMKKQKITGK